MTTEATAVRDEILAFYELLKGHPDVNMIAAGFEEKPSVALAFPDDPRDEQRVVTLRFVARWPKGK